MEEDAFQRHFRTKNLLSFSEEFSCTLEFISPELKKVYFNQNYQFQEIKTNEYECGVYSLGLVMLYMATLDERTKNLNILDPKVRKSLKKLLRIVKHNYSKTLKKLIKAMLFNSLSFRSLEANSHF
jgi:serine/threonine protein kinase